MLKANYLLSGIRLLTISSHRYSSLSWVYGVTWQYIQRFANICGLCCHDNAKEMRCNLTYYIRANEKLSTTNVCGSSEIISLINVTKTCHVIFKSSPWVESRKEQVKTIFNVRAHKTKYLLTFFIIGVICVLLQIGCDIIWVNYSNAH